MLLRALLLSLVASAYAAERAGIHGYYEIMQSEPSEGEAIPGGCSKAQIAELESQWEQIQSASWIGLKATEVFKGQKGTLAMLLSLSNFMAIKSISTEGQAAPPEDSKKVQTGKLRRTLHIVLTKLIAVVTNDAAKIMTHKKTQLFCNSHGEALQLLNPDEKLPIGRGILKKAEWYKDDRDYWFAPDVRVTPIGNPSSKPEPRTKGAYLSVVKEPGYGSNANMDEPIDLNTPTLCRGKHKGWPVYATTILQRQWTTGKGISVSDVTILCPSYFTREDSETKTPLPSLFDLEQNYAVGTRLSAVLPQWITLYTQIIYQILTFHRELDLIVTDEVVRIASPANGHPDKKTYFKDEPKLIQGPGQCQELASYDKAQPYSDGKGNRCIRSPENYAIYVITVWMWYSGKHHQIWGKGYCEKPDDDGEDLRRKDRLPELPQEAVAYPEKREGQRHVAKQQEAKRPRPPPDGSSDNPHERPSRRRQKKKQSHPTLQCTDSENQDDPAQENPNLFLDAPWPPPPPSLAPGQGSHGPPLQNDFDDPFGLNFPLIGDPEAFGPPQGTLAAPWLNDDPDDDLYAPWDGFNPERPQPETEQPRPPQPHPVGQDNSGNQEGAEARFDALVHWWDEQQQSRDDAHQGDE